MELSTHVKYNHCNIEKLMIGEDLDKEERSLRNAELKGYEEIE